MRDLHRGTCTIAPCRERTTSLVGSTTYSSLDDDASADDTIDVDSPAGDADDETPPQSAALVRTAFAAFFLASLLGVAVVAALLLQRPPAPADPVDTPLAPAPLSTAVPNVTPQPGPVPPPETSVSEVPTEAPQAIEPGPQQVPQPQPTTSARPPEASVTNSPATRSPISVAPETCPPFPNQGPHGGGGGSDDGGLLSGPDLPGPL